MTNPKIVVPFKPFVMQEGMTLEDVNNAPNLSAEAKKHIAIFDADGNGTFSKREADVFNATSISTTVFGTSLNTVYKNGEVKSATIQGDVASFRYAPQGEVKPAEVPAGKVIKNDKKEVKTQTAPLQQTTERRPLPPLTQVVGLDTLTYYSKQDSIAFNKELVIHNKKYNEAAKAFNAKYDEAERVFNMEYNEAEKAFNAKYDENQDITVWSESRSKALHEWSESRSKALHEWSESREKSIQEHCSQVKRWQPEND